MKQINRLLTKLEEFQFADIYIHIDLNHWEIRNQLQIRERMHILPEENSFHITWGGINIVKATLELIRAVKVSGEEYDYIWLISGQDYPIVPIKEIKRRLEENKGVNYIDVMKLEDPRYDWYKKLYEVWYPTWINKDNIVVKTIKRIYKIMTGGYSHTFRCFVRKKPFGGEIAVGRQWWTLNSQVAFEMLQFSDDHPEVLTYYKNTIIPDESFFQTIFLNLFSMDMRTASLTCSFLENNKRHPINLTIKEYDKIKTAKNVCCFARKFAENSKELIEIIDSEEGDN